MNHMVEAWVGCPLSGLSEYLNHMSGTPRGKYVILHVGAMTYESS